MQNFLILRELQTEFLKFKIYFAKISYKEFLMKKTECYILELKCQILLYLAFDHLGKQSNWYLINVLLHNFSLFVQVLV